MRFIIRIYLPQGASIYSKNGTLLTKLVQAAGPVYQAGIFAGSLY